MWGATSTPLQATTKNIERLAKEGSLNSDVLPKTIDDAILACISMGIDYLWVDRLCILQDDDPDKKAYWLNSMGEIYAHSYVTIIALAGDNAENGLPGVSKIKRLATWVGTTQGINLIGSSPDYNECIVNSKWVTRGWTFQEATLAIRRLFFSDTKVMYDCSYPRAMQDEIYGAIGKPYIYSKNVLVSYSEMVKDFTQRHLTWESDILRAFAGVLYMGWGPETYYGLPLNIFKDAILWIARDNLYPMRCSCPDDAFPTWSWTSVKSPISMQSAFNYYMAWYKARASLAIWAIPSNSGQRLALQVVANTMGETRGFDERDELESLNRIHGEDTARLEDIADEIEWEKQKRLEDISTGEELRCVRRSIDFLRARLAFLVAWKCGCFSGSLPNTFNTSATWKGYGRVVSNWRSLAQLCDEAHGMPWGNMTEQDMEARFPSNMRQTCPPGSIFVYTQSLYFHPLKLNLKHHIYGGPRKKDAFFIEVGDFVAQIVPKSIKMERFNHARQQNPDALFGLLALSVTPHKNRNSVNLRPQDEAFWNDSAGNSLRDIMPYPLQIELMLVETENGISRRVGLAWAYLKHWVNQNPQFRTFHLV